MIYERDGDEQALKKQEKTFWGNTIMLYIMTFSTQVLNLATMPYLTRVLGPVAYGRISVAIAWSFYLQLILDLGMVLYATRQIAQNRENVDYIEQIVSGVTYLKFALIIILSAILLVLTAMLADPEQWKLLSMYFLSTAIAALIPDFYYRGIEQMQSITIRTLIARSFFTAMIFLVVKGEQQILLVPGFLAIANFIALGISWFDLTKRHVRLRRVSYRQMKELFQGALPYLGSRIASTFYQGLNTILIGALYGEAAVVGFYGAADKLISAIKAAISPVADSLFPYMVKHHDYNLIRKIMRICLPVITACGLMTLLFAESICMFLFGEEYGPTANILRKLLPIAVVLMPSYILCFPVLVPMGLQKYANFSNVIGAVIEIAGLIVLTVIGKINVSSLCVLASTSEVCVFLFRYIAYYRNRNRIKERNGTD